ncbi:Zn-dependent hydrolase of the beta-lactamase fold-like protein [Sulfitobacter noctilucicola]|uniref:L-ascorbate metabolism protein UlaG (Beta-lactamase superfamily) n=1 Tax=Sulfitobacter noctilucicola TaxID=1342301 RepID=A0A7W6Q4V8_9RHOB|nr:MBL fold metallo-hydrolase [Sulfitobacter noctilucicola]KIN63430.1 Zn-dependent hydrolase of the beta-lactamase fold-like protein [Sulfitobacter noctilucicola]MBB4175058.1 L-ascorbate metabolism protein UlaG (beta-lactamase superfamily) [Sulfitobacter noctilucicola]
MSQNFTAPTRRSFLVTGAAAAGTITLLPFAARAAGHGADTFETAAGPITVHPVAHASVVLETPKGTIYVDPVGEAAQYENMPAPDLILITHEHGDHYNEETLQAIVADNTEIIANPAVMGKLSDGLKARASEVANGGTATFADMDIEAIPAYNTTEERLNFHPQGRDNGYVLNFDSFRVYLSGDTEDIPEMRNLQNIDLAFVCMNLPFTMDANAAASAVSEFAPTYVYPYHYRGRDGGTQDPESFAKMIGTGTEVKLGNWYG